MNKNDKSNVKIKTMDNKFYCDKSIVTRYKIDHCINMATQHAIVCMYIYAQDGLVRIVQIEFATDTG